MVVRYASARIVAPRSMGYSGDTCWSRVSGLDERGEGCVLDF